MRLLARYRARFGNLVVAQGVLLLNAGALALGTLSTAVLGFVYWWFAARAFLPEAVGFAAAAISLMNLLAHLGEIGLGPLLLGGINHLPRKGPFVAGALLASLSASILVALAYLFVASQTSLQLGNIAGSYSADTLFVVGCALTGLTLVLDQAFVGLLRSGYQLLRNVLFASGKLFLLVALGLTLGTQASEASIYATWVAGQVLSLLVVGWLLWRSGRRVLHRPDLGALRPVLGHILGHHALSIAAQAPGLILPFVVTILLSPEINAAFYAGWTLLNVALLVPASLSAVLFSVAERDPGLFPARLRISMALSLLTGVGAAAAFFFLSGFMLWVFNPVYADIAGSELRLLGFGALGMAVKYHYLAVQRIRRRLRQATVMLGIGAVVEIALVALGAHLDGISGVTAMWVLAVFGQALVFSPPLISEARRDLLPRRAGATRGELKADLARPL